MEARQDRPLVQWEADMKSILLAAVAALALAGCA
jgi:hypothetical protein